MFFVDDDPDLQKTNVNNSRETYIFKSNSQTTDNPVKIRGKKVLKRGKENTHLKSSAATKNDQIGKRITRKMKKKKDSFIVSDSSSIENDSIVIYHKVFTDEIRRDVEKMTPKSLRGKNSSCDNKTFKSLKGRKAIISSKSESDTSNERNEFYNESCKTDNWEMLDLNLCGEASVSSYSSNMLMKSVSSHGIRLLEMESKQINFKNVSSASSDDFQSCCSGNESLESDISSDNDDDIFQTPFKSFLPSERIPSSSPLTVENRLQSTSLAVPFENKLIPEAEEKLEINCYDSPSNQSSDSQNFSEDSFNFRISIGKSSSSVTSCSEDDEFQTHLKPNIVISQKTHGYDGITFKKPITPILNTPFKRRNNTPCSKKEKINTTKNYLSFLASLSILDSSCIGHPEAEIYKKKFKKLKEELTSKLYKLFNESVFQNQLPLDMGIEWSSRLRKTAGFCRCMKKPISNESGKEYRRIAAISLSTKIIETPDRLRDTLIHEMCHAAVFLINAIDKGCHGPHWKSWARKAMSQYPELPTITICHNYDIKTKYRYRCIDCGYSFGRHSKSLDLNKKCCGRCRGKFELIVNRKTKNGNLIVSPKNISAKPLNKFALFVKENYSKVKSENIELKHGDIMKELSKNFAATKISE